MAVSENKNTSNITEQIDNGIYYRQWNLSSTLSPAKGSPAKGSPAKGVVLLVHGICEHCQRYDPLAHALNNAGYAVSAIDLPNHGRSDGQKGHVESFADFQTAVHGLYQRTKAAYPDSPIFILGHSMGGLITSRFLIDHQDKFTGALLSGPAIQTAQEPPAWQVSLIKGIAKFLPTIGLVPVDGSMVSRDQKVVDAYNSDPLVGRNKLTSNLLVEFDKTMREVKQRAQTIKLPLLIMHGTADQLTMPEGSQWLHDTVASTDKTIRMYEGLYHEAFNEPEAESVFA